MRRTLISAALAALVAAAAGGIISMSAQPAQQIGDPVPPPVEDARAAYGSLPVWFEPNEGQLAPEADFVARAGGRSVFLTGQGPVFALPAAEGGGTAGRSVRLGLVGGTTVAAEGLERLPGTSNYLLGSDPAGWHRDVPQYGRVAYQGVWPGVDLVYHGQDRQLEYDFVVLPGADPSTISVSIDGADGAVLSPEGDLLVSAGGTEIRQSRPVLYQDVDGVRRPVPGAFTLTSPDRFGFRVGAYDTSRPLVIDPVVTWSTPLGGSAADSVNGIDVDANGSAYVTGSTASTNFPSVNAVQPVRNGAFGDAFVAKLNPAGTALLWSTYLGGTAVDEGTGIAVDGAGNATLAGNTASTNFPVLNAAQPAKAAGTTTDAFVTRLNPAGSAITYSTYLGGSLADTGRGVDVDAAGRAHVTGATASTDFPVLNAFQATKGAGTDAFVALLDTSATGAASRLYASYLGGAADDVGNAIAVDSSARSYITGDTRSANFPTVAALKPLISGACPTTNDPLRFCREAFVSKLDPSAAGLPSLVYSTYLGGSTSTFHLEVGEGGMGIAVDGSGSAYVTGDTASDDFPTVNAVQPTRDGDFDAFVTKLTPSGGAIAYSTFLGGAGLDVGRDVDVDPTGSAHVTGNASAGFPRVNPVGHNGSTTDAFVARLTPAGSSLVHSTHLGGEIGDFGRAIAADAAGVAYVGGSSTSADFPTVNPLQVAPSGGNEGFVTRIAPGPAAGPLVTGLTPRSGPPAGGTPVVITGSGFTGATSVRFGAVPATTFQVESNTRLLAISPEGTGPASVTVTTPTGTSPANPVAEYLYAEGLWSPTGPQTQRRLTPTLTLLANGKVLLAGGRSASNGPAMATAELYDPLTNTWTATGSMVTPRYAHTSTLLADGKVLVAAGFTFGPPTFNATGGFVNAGPVTDTSEVFDPATGQWTPAGALGTRRAIHTANLLADGRVLVAGGRTCNLPPPVACDASRFTNTAELFDPVTRTWSPTGSMAYGRHTGDAVTLTDGRVLTAGGFGVLGTADVTPVPGGSQLNLATTEIYDPATGTWSLSGELNAGRARQILVRLLDGRVVAVGGFGAALTTEVFDPATGTWSLSGNLPDERSGHCAVLLPTGDVLSPRSGAHTSALWDPATGDWRPAALTTVNHSCFSGVTRADAVVLSSNPTRFEADPAVCGLNCGKALLAGDTPDEPVGDLYTHAPRITGIGAVSGSPAGDKTVTITGIGFTQATEVRFGSVPATQFRVDSYSQITAVIPPGASTTGPVTVLAPGGRSAPAPFSFTKDTGYWTVASDGGVFAFGDAGFHGSTGGIVLDSPVVGMAATRSGKGYWLVASDGGIFAFGDAAFHGSTGGTRLDRPIVGMERTASGNGYWLVASDGGIFAFGDAAFHGSTGGTTLDRPVVGMERTASGNGYWLVASDGGIFTFGDAAFHGSTGGTTLDRPIVGMERSASGNGYWLVASDGGIFTFGDAPFRGSTGGTRLDSPIVGMARTFSGNGYWLVASDGGIFTFGDAPFRGSTGGVPLFRPIVGIAA